jgi:CubicO group peptidase (beta-lactamase class C family)
LREAEMKGRINIIFIGLFFLSLVVLQGYAKDQIKKISRLEDEVDTYLGPYLEAGVFSGTILIAKAGKVLLSKGYGMACYEFDVPNSPETKFQIASISKTFTSAAIMILQEKGQLSVHDSLNKFIPDFNNGGKISIHNLLTHTSGIPNVNEFPEYDEKSKSPTTLKQIISMFKNKPLDFSPGDRYAYSNSNYNLLAYIIEKVSGMSYGDFLEKNIFNPLEMHDTGHHGDASSIIKELALGYMLDAGGVIKAPYLDWSIKTGNGSIYSTVKDLYKWDRALYTEKILKKKSKEEIFKEHMPGIGYGWFIGKRLNRKVIYYNGRSPGFTSYLDRYVDDDACLIILSNNYTPIAHMIIKDLGAILFDEEYKIPEEIKEAKVEQHILNDYLGSYKFDSNFYRPNAVVKIIKKNDKLYFQWSETYFSSLRPVSQTKFLDLSFWAYIIFQKDKKGEITGFIWRDTNDFPAEKLKKE